MKTRGADQGVAHRRVPVPVGRDLLGVHDLRHRARGRVDGSVEQPHGGRAGRLHLPHVPVPRADRRVHRGARPDPERRGRPAPGAVGARPARSVRRRRTTRSPLPAGKLRIDIREVTFSYPSRDRTGADSAVLKNIDVTIPAGQQVAIVGSTGSGKTTLGRLIARFADPTIGAIELGGVPLRTGRSGRAAAAARRGVAGAVPLRRLDQRQRRASPSNTRRPATSNAWSTNSACGDWVESLSEGLATERRRAWRSVVGGRTAARRPVACRSRRPRRADPRRGDLVGRRADRGPRRPRPRTARRVTHHDRHRPPAVDGCARRPRARAGTRPPRGGRPSRRADHDRRSVPPPVRRLGLGTSV